MYSKMISLYIAQLIHVFLLVFGVEDGTQAPHMLSLHAKWSTFSGPYRKYHNTCKFFTS